MGNLIAIAAGGMIGAVLRYTLSAQVQTFFKTSSFPYGTLAVNIIGCFAIGVLAYLAGSRPIEESLRLFLSVGLLGAFTTFSSFSIETLQLASAGLWLAAATNVLASNLLGLAAVWLGFWLPSLFAR